MLNVIEIKCIDTYVSHYAFHLFTVDSIILEIFRLNKWQCPVFHVKTLAKVSHISLLYYWFRHEF